MAKGLNRLPYLQNNLPNRCIPTKPEAAATLLRLLLNALDDSNRDPTLIIPTSADVVPAQWNAGGVDLEIESPLTVPRSTTSPERDPKNTMGQWTRT